MEIFRFIQNIHSHVLHLVIIFKKSFILKFVLRKVNPDTL